MSDIVKAIITQEMKPKVAKLVQTAFQLFRKHGFQRVSVEEICRTGEVSKVTFYKHYAGKDELIMFIVQRIFEDIKEKSDAILQSGDSIKAKMDKIVALKQGIGKQLGEEMLRGILLLPAARDYMAQLTEESWATFRQFLITEKAKGSINPGVNIDFILVFLQEVNRMYSENRLLGMFESIEDMISQVNEMLLYGILSRESQ